MTSIGQLESGETQREVYPCKKEKLPEELVDVVTGLLCKAFGFTGANFSLVYFC
jgi:hypothetical protein